MAHITTNKKTVDCIFNTLKETSEVSCRVMLRGSEMRKAFQKLIKIIYYDCANQEERKSNVISMYRGWTDFRQWILLAPVNKFVRVIGADIEDVKSIYESSAEFFKLELDQYLLEKKYQ